MAQLKTFRHTDFATATDFSLCLAQHSHISSKNGPVLEFFLPKQHKLLYIANGNQRYACPNVCHNAWERSVQVVASFAWYKNKIFKIFINLDFSPKMSYFNCYQVENHAVKIFAPFKSTVTCSESSYEYFQPCRHKHFGTLSGNSKYVTSSEGNRSQF